MSAQPRTILVGFDGTEGSRRALAAAVDLLGYGSALSVVTVARNGERNAADILASARDVLLEHLVTARYVERVGDPADEIVAAAHELAADLVVVGRWSEDEARDGAPGSVSADVVRHATCDVLVVGA